jgi:serine/tyrosine/threonine adenylyltransferase
MSSAPVPDAAPDITGGWRFDNSYARLPSAFFSRVRPTPVSRPHLVLFNRALSLDLGLDDAALSRPEAASIFAGNEIPSGADPIAQAYAGHQFGNLTRLGDGRAILLGEQLAPAGTRYDIQLKGPGPTPYSRRGDGRAALGPMLREYLISEAMHGLGIPTTRSLAVATTGEPVFREEPLPGAVLTRVAASHIRVGTFVFFSALGDIESLRQLVDHTLARHFAETSEDPAERARLLLEGVVERQAFLIAQWMRVGFVHGVMNTDNMALSGETIDYGPCAFIDAYDPDAVFSSIDHQGRYAFGNQPSIAGWNLARFAEALIPVLHPDPTQALALAQDAVRQFPNQFRRHWLTAMRGKLGLFTEEAEDETLVNDLLAALQETGADYTHGFRGLHPTTPPEGIPLDWHSRWTARLGRQPQSVEDVLQRMRAHNPAVIPRNHAVEEALEDATRRADLTHFHRILQAVSRPYDETGQPAELLQPPPAGTPRCTTFCGT